MKKVFQQNTTPDHGDCMRAVVASLFEDDIKNVPNFIEIKDWWQEFLNYTSNKGYLFKGLRYNLIKFNTTPEDLSLETIKSSEGINGFFFATVFSPKYNQEGEFNGVLHAVVIDKDFNIVHDPNPNYKGLKEYPKHDQYNGILYVTLFEKDRYGE